MSGVVGAQLVGRMWPFVGYLSDRSRNTASRLRLHGEARWLTADSDDNRGLDAAVGRAISDDACVRWYEVTSSLSVCLSVCPPAGGVTGVLAAPGGGDRRSDYAAIEFPVLAWNTTQLLIERTPSFQSVPVCHTGKWRVGPHRMLHGIDEGGVRK